MKEEKDFIGEFFERVSERVGKPPKHLAPFAQELKRNWYDTPQALIKLSDAEFQKMGIPLRVVTAIKEEIKLLIAESTTQPSQGNATITAITAENKGVRITEKSILQSTTKLQQKLMQKYPWIGSQLPKIMQTLLKIVKNIVGDPYEMKFRVLKKSNQKIRELVFDNPPVLVFLKEIGFEQNQQTITLDRIEIHELYFVADCIEAILENHKTQNKLQNQPKNVHKPEKQENLFLPSNIKFPQTKSVSLQQAFSKEQLEQANYAEVLDKLIDYRARLMATPPKNRNLKIYHKKYESRQAAFQQYSLQKEIESSDDAVLVKYWKNVLNANRNSKHFQSRRKMEFDYLIKQKVHKETTIKVRLPNEIIIEAKFCPLQTLKDVFQLVADIVIGDIYLYQSPPVKKLDKLMYQNLQNMQSVPHGSFYLGINSEWYIKKQYGHLLRN